MKTAVRQGAGILHHDKIQEEIRRKKIAVLRVAEINMTYKSHIHYSKKKPLSPIAQEFFALLRVVSQNEGGNSSLVNVTY